MPSRPPRGRCEVLDRPLRPGAAPVLVREGFAWGALLFGPLWLAAHRAWIPAALALAAGILILALTSGAATQPR